MDLRLPLTIPYCPVLSSTIYRTIPYYPLYYPPYCTIHVLSRTVPYYPSYCPALSRTIHRTIPYYPLYSPVLSRGVAGLRQAPDSANGRHRSAARRRRAREAPKPGAKPVRSRQARRQGRRRCCSCCCCCGGGGGGCCCCCYRVCGRDRARRALPGGSKSGPIRGDGQPCGRGSRGGAHGSKAIFWRFGAIFCDLQITLSLALHVLRSADRAASCAAPTALVAPVDAINYFAHGLCSQLITNGWYLSTHRARAQGYGAQQLDWTRAQLRASSDASQHLLLLQASNNNAGSQQQRQQRRQPSAPGAAAGLSAGGGGGGGGGGSGNSMAIVGDPARLRLGPQQAVLISVPPPPLAPPPPPPPNARKMLA